MFAAERRKKIKEIMLEYKHVDMNTLCSLLDVSLATVRRDLDQLSEEGFLQKEHGGVILIENETVRIPSFGHAGDSNLHVYVCRDKRSEVEWRQVLNAAFERMYRKARELNGLVSGEHGIGYAKKRYMAETFENGQLELMCGIKRVFDPNGILNPGKLF